MLPPNQGTLWVGENIKHVLTVCHVVVKTAHIYIMAISIGTPHLISVEDVKAMQYFVRNVYGQR
jgi:virulence-associated protein VapD